MAFALPVTLSLSQPMSFFTYALPILTPILWQGEQVSDCLELSFLPWLNRNAYQESTVPTPQQLSVKEKVKVGREPNTATSC